MKKKINVILIIILFAIGSYYIYDRYFANSYHPVKLSNGRNGNSSGNLANSGYVTNYEGNLYGDINPSGKGIFRSSVKGKELVKLTDDEGLYINVYKDWIYYVNYSDNKTLYKITIKGKNRTKLAAHQADSLNVEDGWLFYIDMGDKGRIYRIDSEGKRKTMVSSDKDCLNLIVKDSKVYYSSGGTVFEMDEDGRNKIKLVSIRSSSYDEGTYWWGNFDVCGQYLVYPGKDGSLYRININGKDNMKLIGGAVESINIYKDHIYYYSNSNKTIYRIELTGTVKTEYVIGGGDYYSINIVDDSGVLFKEKTTENGGLFKVLKNLSGELE